VGPYRARRRGVVAPRVLALAAGSPGKKAWWNAKAGAAITPSMRAEANATANNVFSLTNRDLLPSDGCFGPAYASFPPVDLQGKILLDVYCYDSRRRRAW
jgi:hypothetical protein